MAEAKNWGKHFILRDFEKTDWLEHGWKSLWWFPMVDEIQGYSLTGQMDSLESKFRDGLQYSGDLLRSLITQLLWDGREGRTGKREARQHEWWVHSTPPVLSQRTRQRLWKMKLKMLVLSLRSWGSLNEDGNRLEIHIILFTAITNVHTHTSCHRVHIKVED